MEKYIERKGTLNNKIIVTNKLQSTLRKNEVLIEENAKKQFAVKNTVEQLSSPIIPIKITEEEFNSFSNGLTLNLPKVTSAGALVMPGTPIPIIPQRFQEALEKGESKLFKIATMPPEQGSQHHHAPSLEQWLNGQGGNFYTSFRGVEVWNLIVEYEGWVYMFYKVLAIGDAVEMETVYLMSTLYQV